MPTSQHQRWRERPRCPASRVTQAVGTGSFTPSLVVPHVAVSAHSLCRTNAPPACISLCPDFAGTRRPMNRMEIVRACTQVSRRKHHVCGPRSGSHHRVLDAGAVLSAVNALRVASTRPLAGPSGIDDASARHVWLLRDGGQRVDCSKEIAQMRLTRESRRRILASSRQCRTALPPFAPRANGARIRSAPTGHDIERNPQTSQTDARRPRTVRRRVY